MGKRRTTGKKQNRKERVYVCSSILFVRSVTLRLLVAAGSTLL